MLLSYNLDIRKKFSHCNRLHLTGYLGGAIATRVRVGHPLYFSLIFGIMVWVPLFLTNQKLRSPIPFNKTGVG